MTRAIVIGGGHNGLTCAAALARGGVDVTLLEARSLLGGMAASEPFAEGFRSPGLLHDTRRVRAHVVDALGLDVSLVNPPALLAAAGDGARLSLDRAAGRVSGDVDEADAAAYGELCAFNERVASRFVRRLLDSEPPALLDLRFGDLLRLARLGLSLRRLGADMFELLRCAPMCVADWMRDRFDSELLAATVAAPALYGCFAGPWSPGTAANLLIYEALAGREVKGGAPALVAALERAARAAGVTVETDARVGAIRADGGVVRGVTLEGGREIDAALVVAACDPKQALGELLVRGQLERRARSAARNIRTRGTTAKVHLALSAPLEVSSHDGVVEALRVADSLDDVERAFDPVKYGEIPERPVLDVRVPTASDGGAGLVDKAGTHVVSVLASFVPRDLAGGWDDAARERLGDAVVARLAEVCPDLRERVVAREVLSPADIEQRYGASGGHVHHGEHALDQVHVMRPTIDCARYATPVAGLYLAASGSHPGGGVTCGPGYLAAQRILQQR